MKVLYTFVSIAAPIVLEAECKVEPDLELVDKRPLIRAIAAYAKHAGTGVERTPALDDFASYLARNMKNFMRLFKIGEQTIIHFAIKIWYKNRPRGRSGRPITISGMRLRMRKMELAAERSAAKANASK